MEESTGKTGFDPQAEWMNCKGLKFAARWQYVCLVTLVASASRVQLPPDWVCSRLGRALSIRHYRAPVHLGNPKVTAQAQQVERRN
jgi:hypothetical protein